MALTSAANNNSERIGQSVLLADFLKTVAVILDLSSSSSETFSSVKNFSLGQVHHRVKAILKHGARIRHHFIFDQPSFASFDTWLEERLLDHSLPGRLLHVLKGFGEEYYYDWALVREETTCRLFIKGLRVLSYRDWETFCDVQLEVLTKISAEKEKTRSFKMEESEEKATTSTSTISIPIPSFSYSLAPSPICSPPTTTINQFDEEFEQFEELEDIPPLRVSRSSSVSSLASTTTLTPRNNNSKGNRSFLECDGLIAPPASIGNFPLPEKGQSLTGFLLSLSDDTMMTMPDLDRENAHFNVSEALISAFERLKVTKSKRRQKLNSPKMATIRGGEIEDLFGTVIDKCQKKSSSPSSSLVSPSSSNASTPTGSETLVLCSEDPKPVEEANDKYFEGKKFHRPPIMHTETEESELEYWRQRRHPQSHLSVTRRRKPRPGTGKTFKRSELSLMTTSTSGNGSSVPSTSATTEEGRSSSSSDEAQSQLDDDDVLSSSSFSSSSCSFSAENLALKLLKNAQIMKDDEHLLPSASELRWLISETQAPQKLLPMPKDWSPTSEEDESNASSSSSCTRLRGTSDWAPPRPQIIFNIHPPPNLASILKDVQRYRCAGCGMRVNPKYASTFRYCFYLGRYFCTGCHTGKRARLPQLILHKWDFSPYLVSNFSFTLLERLSSDPVYNVLAINPSLTKKKVKLNNFRNYRIQLGYIIEYLRNCRKTTLYEESLKFPSYYAADVDLCSLEDLLGVRFSSGLPMVLKDFVSSSIRHVLDCNLCGNLGFICELCAREDEILFAFQINKVSRCGTCSSCYHLKCFNPQAMDCPKCLRIRKRQEDDGGDDENVKGDDDGAELLLHASIAV